ncbi:MAG: 23S rRNA (adenine(2503)-C(2))-methyltransferase RlmN, partial [Nitrospinae bacterium]|nr:23S rRNA (adenine(2503)-C(2))-methyltransferase RlmN [Nitrospinota bacterium]
KRLAKLLHGIPSKINLIPFNGFAESDYQAPAEATILAFQKYLLSKNYSVFIRKNRGTDILGACGQLAARSFKETSVTVPS